MNQNLNAILISLMSGIATIIGYLLIYIKGSREGIISKVLGFSSGVMFGISMIDLIPSSLLSLNSISKNIMFLLVISSLFIGILISRIVNLTIEKKSKKQSKLYKLGILNMFILILHNIPEGIVTYIALTSNVKLGIILAIAIALHNIPEGIAISIPIYYSTNSKFKAFLYTLISALSEPLGAIISCIFLSKYINVFLLGIIYSLIAGMMINISINELYKEASKHNKKDTIVYFILGIFVMILNHIILG